MRATQDGDFAMATLRGGTVLGRVLEVESDLPGEGTMLVICGGGPEVVRLPRELGGTIARVMGTSELPCPCGGPDEPTLVLANGLKATWCSTRSEYLWWRAR